MTYLLYLLSFLLFPLIVIVVSIVLELERFKKLYKYFGVFFAIHNLLFFIGFSLKGDYPDYIVFSCEYLYFCFVIALFKQSKKSQVRLISFLGIMIMTFGFLQGLLGVFFFIPISKDYETDKVYHFVYDNCSYESRRYCFGFVTLESPTYTFDTYRTFMFIPFEIKKDKTVFLETKNNMNLDDEKLRINLVFVEGKKMIRFSSRGKTYDKILE